MKVKNLTEDECREICNRHRKCDKCPIQVDGNCYLLARISLRHIHKDRRRIEYQENIIKKIEEKEIYEDENTI